MNGNGKTNGFILRAVASVCHHEMTLTDIKLATLITSQSIDIAWCQY